MRSGKTLAEFLSVAFASIGIFAACTACAEYDEHADVQKLIEELVVDHDFDREELTALFRRAERQDRIIELISKPAEKAKPWHEYRDIFVTTKRTNAGVTFWDENLEALERAQTAYGVDPHIIVSIIGVETYYGRLTGTFRVIDALSTLAFDYPPRAPFFRKELKQFLLLAKEEGKDPLSLSGSYAGAMGFGQFIPSSYREYAVDFDGDGLRDIWGNETDAIGSVANYFKRHGWRGDEVVAVPVGLNDASLDSLANTQWKPSQTIGEFKRQGVQADGLADETSATLMRMDGADGPEYWLGMHDFYVITRYNHSRMYALAVLQLAEAIQAARGPSQDRSIAVVSHGGE